MNTARENTALLTVLTFMRMKQNNVSSQGKVKAAAYVTNIKEEIPLRHIPGVLLGPARLCYGGAVGKMDVALNALGVVSENNNKFECQ